MNGDTIFEQTTTEYDAASNVIKMTSYARKHTSSATGELDSTSARLTQVGYWQDGIGRQIGEAKYGTGSLNRETQSTVPSRSDSVLVTTTAYNHQGDAYQAVDPAGREDRAEFDHAGRIAKSIRTYTDGNAGTGGADEDVTVETTYSADGAIATLVAKNSATGDQVTTYVYGSGKGGITPLIYRTDLLRAVIYPNSDDPADLSDNGADGIFDRVEYKYNRQGERVEMKDQNETVHGYTYDKRGRQLTDEVTSYSVGNEIDVTVRKITRTYDVIGRLETVSSYDASADVVNEVKNEYDALGETVLQWQEHSGEVGASSPSVTYTYADATASRNRLAAITYPNGRVLHREFASAMDDALGRVTYLSDGDADGTRLAEYRYIGLDRVLRIEMGRDGQNDPVVDFNLDHGPGGTYDGLDVFGRVKDLRWTNHAGTTTHVQIKHGYDRVGNRLWREDPIAAANGEDLDERYTYDGIDRLTKLNRGNLEDDGSGGKQIESGTLTLAEEWALDATGNWTNFKQDTDTGSSGWEVDQIRSHNRDNEISQIDQSSNHIAYDIAGNMTKIPQSEDWTDNFNLKYDAWNRLVRVADGQNTVAEYRYDGLGRRITRVTDGTTRHFYYSHQWQVLEERLNASTDACCQYVWGVRHVDDLVLRDHNADGSGTTGDLGVSGSGLEQRLYALQDANFNVVALASSSGVIQERYVYTAYGRPFILASDFGLRTSGTSYNWCYLQGGRDLDPVSGLYDHRTRHRHPGLGRFTTRDTAGYTDGMNLYQHAGGNPLLALDPDGLQSQEPASHPFSDLFPPADVLNTPVSRPKLCLCDDAFRIKQEEGRTIDGAGGMKCKINLECKDRCDFGSYGFTDAPVRQGTTNFYDIRICVSHRLDLRSQELVFLHERIHAMQFCDLTRGIDKSNCVEEEGRAHGRSCNKAWPADRDKRGRCKRCGVYLSCRRFNTPPPVIVEDEPDAPCDLLADLNLSERPFTFFGR